MFYGEHVMNLVEIETVRGWEDKSAWKRICTFSLDTLM